MPHFRRHFLHSRDHVGAELRSKFIDETCLIWDVPEFFHNGRETTLVRDNENCNYVRKFWKLV